MAGGVFGWFLSGPRCEKGSVLRSGAAALERNNDGKGKRCGSCSACIAKKKKKKGRKRAYEHPIEKQTPRLRKQKTEAERLSCGISPAMFRLPQEPKAEPLVVRKEPTTGERKEAKPSGEKGLDPKAATQIRHLKQQSQELDTKVAGAFALLLFCSFALLLLVSLTACDRSCSGVRVPADEAEAAARDRWWAAIPYP